EALPHADSSNSVAALLLNNAAAVDVEPRSLAEVSNMVGRREITPANARVLLERLAAEGGDPAAIVEREQLGALGDDGQLDAIVEAALAANADAAEKIRGGNMKAIGPIIGHVMRETKGRADGGEVTRLVRAKLGL
ncbi:MAG TPA: GatB/YqeY domain-containing protein, partial [Solirubrobacteraceae bacterium]|nr:GatB/YqeY domain-containing protein [Solirubrobacteraceae bacterium]